MLFIFQELVQEPHIFWGSGSLKLRLPSPDFLYIKNYENDNFPVNFQTYSHV